MIGVTVATPGWEEMANEAAMRWMRHTGNAAEIRKAKNREEVRDVKLNLTGARWFFDADLWFVRRVELPALGGACAFGTPVVPSAVGREIIRSWAKRAGVDPACWISSGFYGADWDTPAAKRALGFARDHAIEWNIRDRDEEPLNVGLQRAGLPLGLLPSAYNWHPRCGAGYGYEPPEGIVAIHAGDVPAADKWEFLRRYAG
jgi:hypothetical protein